MAQSIYVMSDIHGHLNKFIRMLRHINFDDTDKLLILGNVVNGGPQPIELLCFIAQNENIRMSLGLHELIMLSALLENDLKMFDEWVSTLDGRSTYNAYNELNEEKKHYILNYLKESCPSFFTMDNFFLSNNGISIWDKDFNTNLTTKKPTFKEVLERDEHQNGYVVTDANFYTKAGLSDKIMIFGGVAVQQIRKNTNYKIWHDPIYQDKICINSGIGITPHKLACLRLNDLAEFYI